MHTHLPTQLLRVYHTCTTTSDHLGMQRITWWTQLFSDNSYVLDWTTSFQTPEARLYFLRSPKGRDHAGSLCSVDEAGNNSVHIYAGLPYCLVSLHARDSVRMTDDLCHYISRLPLQLIGDADGPGPGPGFSRLFSRCSFLLNSNKELRILRELLKQVEIFNNSVAGWALSVFHVAYRTSSNPEWPDVAALSGHPVA